MYTAVVFYFSGTGNTWWVADRIKRQLDAKNINASAVSIDKLTPKKADWWIKTADLILFGWPVYGSDLPAPVKRFINALPESEKGKHVHVFCTQMGFSGDGAWVAHKRLKSKGLIVDTAEHFTMPSNMSMIRGFLGTPDEKSIKRILANTESQVERYTERLLTGQARVKGRFGYPLGILQRGPYGLYEKKSRNCMGVDKDRCTHCGLCASLCPMKNITLSEVPEFAGNCTQCLRCYSFCPVSAITYNGRVRDIQKYGKPYSIPDKHFKPSLLVK
jgi:ferredoxin/flavodoxin